MTSLVGNLGGAAGFGEFSLARNDDGSTSFIDLRAVFGTQGINFFGDYYTGLYLNNNGSVTFNAATGSFTPSAITGSTSNPIIAAYWADIDTRGGPVTPTPGGTSTGSNLLWYDLDSTTHTFTATWDDVGYFNSQTNKLNAFQISIKEINEQGDFDITFRYENVDWTTGSASGGSNGLGGTPARAGYSAGNGVEYFELPQSGNEAALLALESASNVGTPGTFVFQVRNGAPTVAISVGDASVSEGNAPGSRSVTIPVVLTEPSSSTITVHYTTANGSAGAGDYVGQSGILTFAPGVTHQDIVVAVTGDTDIEGDETFTVTLSEPSEGVSILDGSATATIVNDDASLSIAATSADKAEGQSGSTSFTFTVTRTGDVSGAATAQWAVSGAAVNGADFAGGILPTGVVSFAAGETSKVIAIDVAADSLVELNEAFSVTLSNPSAGAVLGTASAAGVIRNDDASLSIAATSADKAEGQSGDASFTFTVTRTGDVSGGATAHWAVAGSAVNGADFAGGVLPSGVVSFAAGETSKVIEIAVAGDSAAETDEAFSVTLSDPSAGAVLGTASATGVIRNDDASLSIAATGADRAEGQSGDTLFTFTVNRTGDVSGGATAQWVVTGSAVNGADFAGGILPSGVVSFAAGETSKVIEVAVAGDTLVELNETFSVTLSDPDGAVLGTASAAGVIRNDDASLSIAATDADTAEGQSETSSFSFTVTRTGDVSGAATAHWAVSGAAVDGADFAGGIVPTGVVSFAAGETSKVIDIGVAGNSVVEPDEAFSVTLSDPDGAVLGTASAAGVIRNDDASLSIAATGADRAEGQSGDTSFTFTVTRTGDVSGSATAHWAVTGDAVDDADFAGGALPSGVVSFAAGETSKVIGVEVVGDTPIEPDEAFSVTLSNPSTGTVLGTASADGVIRNDDASLSIEATGADMAEGHSETTSFTFIVTRTGDVSGVASAQWAVIGAVNGADFADGVLPSGVVSFAAGETSQVISIEVAGDSLAEPDEDFSVTLSDPSVGAVIDTASADGVIRNDDAALSIEADSIDNAEGDVGATAFTFTVTRSGDTTAPVSVDWAVSGAEVTGSDFVPSEDLLGYADLYSYFVDLFEAIRPGFTSHANVYAYLDALFPAFPGGPFLGNGLPSGTVSFEAGETSKTLTVWALGETVVEGDESFRVTLSNASVGSSIDTSSAVATIRNDDHQRTTIETSGATQLDQVADLFFLRDGADNGPSLKYDGADVVAGQFGAWMPLGAEMVGSGYQVVWKNGADDEYMVWTTDSDGNWTSQTGTLSGSDLVIQTAELTFEQDLNADGTLGPTAPPRPDLVVDSITPAATSVVQGAAFNFSYVIENAGAMASGQNWAGIMIDHAVDETHYVAYNAVNVLTAGASQTFNNSIDTSGLGAGTYTLHVAADYWHNMVGEGNEANNALSVTFEVTAAPRPDLVVDSITPAATSVMQGAAFNFSYVIENAGAVASGQNWAGIMVDHEPDASHYVGFGLTGGLAVDGVQALNGSIDTSGLAVGIHTLYVAADYWHNMVGESDEANNALSVTFEVTAAPRPDLVVDSITPAATSVVQGAAFNFSYVIENAGAVGSGQNWAGIMVDREPDASHYIGFGLTNGLAADGVQALNGSIDTSGLAVGIHTLYVAADYWHNMVGESDEANNALSVTFEVTAAPRPDLVVDSITPATTSVVQGAAFNFSYVIENAGAVGSGQNWAGIMVDREPDASHYIGFGLTNGLAVDGVQALNGSIDTSGLAVGTHTLYVAADYWHNMVNESDEANNALSVTFEVTAAPRPDLVVDSITPAATSVVQGAAFNFSYVIENAGAVGSGQNWAGIMIDHAVDETHYVAYNAVNVLAAGASQTFNNSIDTSGLGAGTYTLHIAADYWHNMVGEGNEANNALSVTFTVTDDLFA